MRPLKVLSVAALSLILAQVVFQGDARAAVFPDVPESHLYRQPIEVLVGMGIINGNPDGNFSPDRYVNRAEMLTMLFRARSIRPDPPNAPCFPDVVAGSWYESVVCHGALMRYVAGYSDGLFRPEKTVSRAESLKMIAGVFSIPIPDLDSIERQTIKYADVSISAWYTKYIYAAFAGGILPIPGQEGGYFKPDAPLKRGEAAAYLYNALQMLRTEHASSSAFSRAQRSHESVDADVMPAPAKSSARSAPPARDITVPFEESASFVEKYASVYRLAVEMPTTVQVTVSAQGGAKDKISCRLFRLEENGFSEEYYLGREKEGGCTLRAALATGSYQLELRSSVPDSDYALKVQKVTGDGSDGFAEAKNLPGNVVRTGVLEADDFGDYFTFTIAAETQLTVELISTADLQCLIYPLADVDLYGFEGPECNVSYKFPKGTYVVSIGHDPKAVQRQTYTVRRK